MKGEFRPTVNGGLMYCVFLKAGSRLHSSLGEIRKKNDNRYFWYRKQSDFVKDWIHEVNGNIAQGTEETLELAKMRILEGWSHATKIKNTV